MSEQRVAIIQLLHIAEATDKLPRSSPNARLEWATDVLGFETSRNPSKLFETLLLELESLLLEPRIPQRPLNGGVHAGIVVAD